MHVETHYRTDPGLIPKPRSKFPSSNAPTTLIVEFPKPTEEERVEKEGQPVQLPSIVSDPRFAHFSSLFPSEKRERPEVSAR